MATATGFHSEVLPTGDSLPAMAGFSGARAGALGCLPAVAASARPIPDTEAPDLGKPIGVSAAFERALQQVAQVGPTDATVLITGETGTGKELIARRLHAVSARRQRPLVVVNCTALPATLVESELFGHERGAFTGALQRKPGRFGLAAGGANLLGEGGRRAAGRHAGEAAARAAGAGVRPGGRGESGEGGRAGDRGDKSAAGAAGGGGTVSGGPILPTERVSVDAAAAARTAGGYLAAGGLF